MPRPRPTHSTGSLRATGSATEQNAQPALPSCARACRVWQFGPVRCEGVVIRPQRTGGALSAVSIAVCHSLIGSAASADPACACAVCGKGNPPARAPSRARSPTRTHTQPRCRPRETIDSTLDTRCLDRGSRDETRESVTDWMDTARGHERSGGAVPVFLPLFLEAV